MADRPDPNRKTGTRSRALLLGLVALSIALQLVNASLIKFASSHLHSRLPVVALVLATVLVLAFGRLMVWNAMHKRFPVSLAYPATALFFPCLVVLAAICKILEIHRNARGIFLLCR